LDSQEITADGRATEIIFRKITKSESTKIKSQETKRKNLRNEAKRKKKITGFEKRNKTRRNGKNEKIQKQHEMKRLIKMVSP
jgi:hypothetical protein